MSYLITIKELNNQYISDEVLEHDYNIMKRKDEVGIKDIIFDSGSFKTGLPKGTKISYITKEFKNIKEYQMALYTANKLIDEEKELPIELKTKLIKAKNDIEKYEKKTGIKLFFGY